MFDQPLAIRIEELESLDTSDHGEIVGAAIMYSVYMLSTERSMNTPLGPVDYVRLIPRPCGHAGCADKITFNLN